MKMCCSHHTVREELSGEPGRVPCCRLLIHSNFDAFNTAGTHRNGSESNYLHKRTPGFCLAAGCQICDQWIILPHWFHNHVYSTLWQVYRLCNHVNILNYVVFIFHAVNICTLHGSYFAHSCTKCTAFILKIDMFDIFFLYILTFFV